MPPGKREPYEKLLFPGAHDSGAEHPAAEDDLTPGVRHGL